jgi:hypothetical protein
MKRRILLITIFVGFVGVVLVQAPFTAREISGEGWRYSYTGAAPV